MRCILLDERTIFDVEVCLIIGQIELAFLLMYTSTQTI